MKIVIIPGLTLPEVSDSNLASIRKAAGDGAEVELRPAHVLVEGRVRREVVVVALLGRQERLRVLVAVAHVDDGAGARVDRRSPGRVVPQPRGRAPPQTLELR